MRLMAGQEPGYAADQMGHSVDMFVHRNTTWMGGGHDVIEESNLEDFFKRKNISPKSAADG